MGHNARLAELKQRACMQYHIILDKSLDNYQNRNLLHNFL